MKIILADDHALFREGLRTLLEPLGDCLEASDLGEMLGLLEQHPETELILMDLKMPGLEDLETLGQVRRQYPRTPLIVVSMHEEPEIIRAVLALGVSGYIPKSHTFESMRRAIELVLSGSPYVPQEALEHPEATTNPTAIQLTHRQKEIHALLMQGKSNQEIADALSISLSTVKMHVGTVLEKFGVKSRAQLQALGQPPLL